MMQGSIFYQNTHNNQQRVHNSNSVTFITSHEPAFITVSAPENDRPVVVGVAPPAALTDGAGIHPVASTLTAGAAHHLGVLKHHIIPLLPSHLF